MVGCLIVGAYAAFCAWRQGGAFTIAVWILAGLILHDLVGFPVYSYVDRVIQSRTFPVGKPRLKVSWLNHIRVPMFLSAVLLITAFPLIARLSANQYERLSGVSESAYLLHWVAITFALFGLSGLLFAYRLWRAGRR
jgi:hypothetical protein